MIRERAESGPPDDERIRTVGCRSARPRELSAVKNRNAVDWWADRYLLALAGLVLVVGEHLVAVAFQTLPPSIVSPVVNTQGVIAVFLGSFLLGEPHIRVRLAAAGLAVFGIVLISVG